MSTSEELRKLKDTSKFELLATAVLSKAEHDYRAILHSGLNAQGQPRKSPVDGFCQIPNSKPPHFIWIEHTIEEKLEKKWLSDHRIVQASTKGRKNKLSESDDGDLLKAGLISSQYKSKFPEARFTVVLTTNQGLQPDLCLKVFEKAEELGVSVDFWDRSRIARFLDTESEGQWLRKEYLDMEAEMLSETLLNDLCKMSLNEYQKQFLTNPERWVSRTIDCQLEKAIENKGCSINLLVGNSGSGKSASAYQIAKKHLEAGGYSLRLSENVLSNSDSLENALDKALHNLYPSLMLNSGNEIFRLLKGKRLLLIADDINQSNSPTNLLQKIVNWSKPSSSNTSDVKSLLLQHLLICPVWSNIVKSIIPEVDKTAWMNSVYIGNLTHEEGLEAVRDALSPIDVKLTNTEVSTLAEKLGSDPILIGSFASLLLTDNKHHDLKMLAENIIDSFISRTIEDAAREGDLLIDEYRPALSSLTTHMLQNRKLNPKLAEIKAWLGSSSEEMNAVRMLIKIGKLCRIESEKLVFRHDRIREYLLVESMGKLLDKANEPLDIFWEPYYAEIIGQAIVQNPQSEEFLQELCDRLPLALVIALEYSSTTANNLKVVGKVQNWLCRNIENNTISESLLDGVYSSLMKVNSPSILEITETLAPNRAILLSRLRNGCTKSGIRYLAHCNKFSFFAPVLNDSEFNEILSHAKLHYKDKLLSDLKQVLNSNNIPDEYRDGALTLAGFLKYFELENDIMSCWEMAYDKSFILTSTIWAVSRCYKNESLYQLESLLIYWYELINTSHNSKQYAYNWFTSESIYEPQLSYEIGSSYISYFISQAKKYESFDFDLIIARILNRVNNSDLDSADIIEYIIRTTSSLIQNVSKTTYLNLFENAFSRIWVRVRFENYKLSNQSMDRLRYLWLDPDNEKLIIDKASRLWFEGANLEQLDDLKKIESDSTFFHEALQKRIQLGDYSVIKDEYLLFSTEVRWLHQSQHIWCDSLIDIVEIHIQSIEKNISIDFSSKADEAEYILSELLTLVPISDAEKLLEKYWSYLGYSRRFIQVALYIATPKCLVLADTSIRQCPKDALVFYGIMVLFRSAHEKQMHLNNNHLKLLAPYLDQLKPFELESLETISQEIKAFEWGKQYLKHRHSEENQKKYYPLDNDLLQELDELANHEYGILRIVSWIKEVEKRHRTIEDALTLMESWLKANPILQRYRISSKGLEVIGSRNHLSLLDKYPIEGSPNEIALIKMNTRFSVYRRTLD